MRPDTPLSLRGSALNVRGSTNERTRGSIQYDRTMKVGFKDFLPEVVSPAKGYAGKEGHKPGRFGTFEEAVDNANVWIAAQGVQVINVETVALPGIHRPFEEGSVDPSLPAREGEVWHQFVRVWFVLPT